MENREFIEIPLDEHDAELLPSLYERFRSNWSNASEMPSVLTSPKGYGAHASP